jgi:hypothetical protein
LHPTETGTIAIALFASCFDSGNNELAAFDTRVCVAVACRKLEFAIFDSNHCMFAGGV